jgi:hypothetical protein
LYISLKYRLTKYFAVALAALCVTACVDVERPPASWGELTPAIPSDDCASLHATYRNMGNKIDGTVVSLAVWVSRKNGFSQGIGSDLTKAETVTLEIDGNLLTFKTYGADGAYHQWSFDQSKHEFACLSGVLRISQGGNKSGQNIAAVGAAVVDLYRKQNELFVNSHGGTAGVALMIPMADSYSAWARFPVQASGLSSPQ